MSRGGGSRIQIQVVLETNNPDRLNTYIKDIVTDLLKVLLGNRLVNTYHNNECTTIGHPLLGNAWVDTPDNT
jgi:hypothetical protein